MAKLFGTDGVRGIAGRELGCELAMNLGKAAVRVLGAGSFLIARDTRLSSPMLSSAVCTGVCSMGAQVTDLGVLPTPGLSFFVREGNHNGGIMISASHNPWEYNGVKIFDSKGRKLSSEDEEMIEKLLYECRFWSEAQECGRIIRYRGAEKEYAAYLADTLDADISNFDIAVDCANGAVSSVAKQLFESLGSHAAILFDSPDGKNINYKCGSTDMNNLCEYVRGNHLDCGIALDGDGDRCLFADENGDILDGDMLMAICAADMNRRGTLRNKRLVATVMSNTGLMSFCNRSGITTELCDVGDKNVAMKMKESGCNLGGEQSGHIIFSDYCEHGDGLLTALQVLSVMKRQKRPLSALASEIPIYPRIEKSITATDSQKERLEGNPDVIAAVGRAEKTVSEKGRVVVRASGTEPCIRIMLQGSERSAVEEAADTLEKDIIEILK